MPLKLAKPNWTNLLGGTEEAAWIADRDRKLGNIAPLQETISNTFEALRSSGALFRSSPEIIFAHPFAARWYVSLAGFANKTLSNIVEAPKNAGMKRRVGTLVSRLETGTAPNREGLEADVAAFAKWINSELEEKYPTNRRGDDLALITVSIILGGRIIGQGQNQGGNEAVVVVKDRLVSYFDHHLSVFVEVGGKWERLTDEHNVPALARFRFGRLVCDFVPGGNRPDMIVSVDSGKAAEVMAVAEIKARKDISNVWESWMPQLTGHLRTWKQEFPEAARLFIGTLITNEMVEGVSKAGTQHVGLRTLHDTGQLTAPFNLGKLVAGDATTQKSFRQLFDQLLAVAKK